MRRKTLAFTLIIVTLLLVVSMTGCVKDVDGKHNGLSIGFNYEHPKTLPPFITAVRSDKTEFTVDEVILDFYLGWQGAPPSIVEPSENNTDGYTIGFAVYLMNPNVGYKIDEQGRSYLDLESIFYIMEIPANEFILEDYKVNITKRSGKQFRKSESLTLPKELFQPLSKDNSGFFQYTRIWFGVATIWYSYEEGEMISSRYPHYYKEIKFEYINENTVRLSK